MRCENFQHFRDENKLKRARRERERAGKRNPFFATFELLSHGGTEDQVGRGGGGKRGVGNGFVIRHGEGRGGKGAILARF